METTPATTAVPSRVVSEYHEKDIEKEDSDLKHSQTPSLESTPEEAKETRIFSEHTQSTKDEKHVETAYDSRPASVRSSRYMEKETAIIADEKDVKDVRDDEPLDESNFPHGLKLAVIIIGLCLSVFLVALDNTIIATAIPKITDQFHALDDVGWYGSAYLLTTCSFQLLFGKFYSFFSIKWVYLIAISVFELGSLICGVAPNSLALIVGRAIAGLGSAGIFSGALIVSFINHGLAFLYHCS